jgi:hypothetical protein
MSTFHYARFSATFKFIACPRGNGLDTHRFWESLSRHCIPVVEESEWSRNMVKYVPLAVIPYWEKVDFEAKNLIQNRVSPNFKIDYLDTEWWKQRIQTYLFS